MGKSILVDFKGLVTAPGLLLRAEASCVLARNLIFDAPGLFRKRPGFARLPNEFGGSVFQVHSSPVLNDRFLVHYGGGSDPDLLRVGTGLTPSAAVGSIDGQPITRPSTLKQRLALMAKNHYLTSDEGLRRVEEAITSARYAGMPRGLNPSQDCGSYVVLNPTLPLWLPDGSAVAYRVTWHRLDDSGVEMGGAPTGRAVVRNIAGTAGHVPATAASVVLQIPLPVEFGTIATPVTTSYYWRLWRSRDSTGEPDDEMYLVAEAFVTAGDIVAGFATATDLTPSTLLTGGPKLHTNPVNFPDGEANLKNGVLNADDPPPLANDVATWRERVWVADVRFKSSYTVKLVSVGGTGLVAGDTVSLDGVNIMTAVVGPPAANQFTIELGLPTLALNIEATARNIVDRHNLLYGTPGTSGVFGFYVSVGNQEPGVIFGENNPQLQSLTYSTSRPAAFQAYPPGPNAFGGTNVLMYSKPNRGDAFAPANLLTVGPGQATILRVVPYRDRLLVFTDVGIYEVTGTSWNDFVVAPYDLSFRLRGRSLVGLSDDAVFAWCFEGIIRIDGSGITVISNPIEPTLMQITQGLEQPLADYGFVVAYRLQHRVLFFFPVSATADQLGCHDALCFDTRTEAWSDFEFLKNPIGTENDVYKSCGTVRHSDDRAILGWFNPAGFDGWLFEERRAFTAADFQDSDATGLTFAVTCEARFQFQVPLPEGSVHWQETVLHFDGGEFVWRPLPSTFKIAYYDSHTSGSATLSRSASAAHVRVEPPTGVRRSNRLSVYVANSDTEFFGLVGLVQVYRPGSIFSRNR